VIDYLHLDYLISPVIDHSITGPKLLNLESKDLKSFGVSGDDKMKLKKKVKELNKPGSKVNCHHHHQGERSGSTY